MAPKDIVSLDSKARIVIPHSIRESIGVNIGEKLIIYSENRKIILEPSHEKKLLHLDILLADSPGSLAKAATALSNLGVDLVSTQSRSSNRGEAAIWSIECNPGKAKLSEIKKALGSVGSKVLSSSKK